MPVIKTTVWIAKIPRNNVKQREIGPTELGRGSKDWVAYFVTHKTIVVKDPRRSSNGVVKGDVEFREKCRHQSM